MIKVPCDKEHFNLYYIFLEDKQNNALSEEKAKQIKGNILTSFRASEKLRQRLKASKNMISST